MNRYIKLIIPLSCFALLSSCGNDATAKGKASRPKINLRSYVTIEYEGYNTVGNWKRYGIDCEKMFEDYPEAFGITDETASEKIAELNSDFLKAYEHDFKFKVVSAADGKIEPEGQIFKLCNGDVVQLVSSGNIAGFAKKYNVDIIGVDDLTFTVEGLQELQEIDPFDIVTVSFVDDPYTEVEGDRHCYSSVDKYNISYIPRKFDKEVAFTGETVTLEFITDSEQFTVEELFAKEGYKPTTLKKEYTVE